MAKKTTKTVKAVKKTAKAKPKAAKAPAPAPRQALTPYLYVADAAGALAWYKKALNAKVLSTNQGPGNKIMHAELRVIGELVYVADIFPGSDMVDPTRSGMTFTMSIWHKDAKKLFDSCVANGAKVIMPYADQFWGETYGVVRDPHGHSWSFSSRSKLNAKQLEQMRADAMKSFGA